MVTIGGKPILWHIMKYYAHFGHNQFYVALGYKAEVVKEYFLHYRTINTDFTVNLKSGEVNTHQQDEVDWEVTLVDTGMQSMTGGRVKRMKPYICNETCLLTYGDGNIILTQSKNVKKFEYQWSKWLGVKYSVFVNSGSSANLLIAQTLLEGNFLKNKTVLITGGTGFIGHHLLKAAKKKCWQTTSVSLNYPKEERFVDGVRYLHFDIAETSLVRKYLVEDFNYVVNLGGYINHKLFRDGGRSIIETHFTSLQNLLER